MRNIWKTVQKAITIEQNVQIQGWIYPETFQLGKIKKNSRLAANIYFNMRAV